MAIPFGPNEVAINDVFFNFKGKVQSVPDNEPAPKFMIGDRSKDRQRRRSFISWSDLRGGILQHRVKDDAEAHRSWYSTAQAHEGHLVLPALATTTADVGGAGDDTANVLIEYSGGIYADFSGGIYTYDDNGDSWGSALHTLPEPASDAIVWRSGTTVYLVFATRNGYTYYDGTTWTDDTENMIYLTVWNDQLWGIDVTGRLRRSSTIGAWTDDAIAQVEDGKVTDLFVSGDASNNPIIYAATTRGLFAHDNANTKFVETELGMPQHPDNGMGSRRWLGRLYLPSGLGVYEYVADSSPAAVNLVGLDRDDGLPSDRRGKIVQLEGSSFRLFALVTNTIATAFTTSSITALDAFSSSQNRGRGSVFTRDLGVSVIFAWDRVGWQVAWESAASTEPITVAVVAGAYGKHRLWWGQNQRVFYMDLPVDVVNPTQLTTYEYASAFTHLTPWFTGGQTEVEKLALLLRAETTNPTTSETLAISYRINYSTDDGDFTTNAWTAISASGETELPFPVSGDAVGVSFRAIQFRIVAAQGSNNKNTPDLIALTLEWRQKIPLRWSNTVELVIADKSDRKTTAEDQWAALLTALGSSTLVKFQTGPESDQSFFGDLATAPGVKLSGLDRRGSIKVTHVEP